MQWRTVHAANARFVAAFVILATLSLVPAVAQAQLGGGLGGGQLGGAQLGGSAYGASVKTLLGGTSSPVATLPSDGGYNVVDAQTFGVPGAVDASWLTAMTTGSSRNGQDRGSSAQSVSELENVSVLGGVIQAQNVTAIANSYSTATSAASNADGSRFIGLVVNGISMGADIAPNTRVDLLGIGYAILNEQTRSGDGVATSGLIVNMIHVFQATGGEIIVGSASSSVSP